MIRSWASCRRKAYLKFGILSIWFIAVIHHISVLKFKNGELIQADPKFRFVHSMTSVKHHTHLGVSINFQSSRDRVYVGMCVGDNYIRRLLSIEYVVSFNAHVIHPSAHNNCRASRRVFYVMFQIQHCYRASDRLSCPPIRESKHRTIWPLLLWIFWPLMRESKRRTTLSLCCFLCSDCTCCWKVCDVVAWKTSQGYRTNAKQCNNYDLLNLVNDFQ